MAVDQTRRVKAASSQRKAYRLGIKRRVNASRARQYLQLLRRTMSIQDIAEAADMAYTAIWAILHDRETVLPATERKILAVTPINGAVLLDSIGARRRVQALATKGWTVKEIGRQVAKRRGDAWANITRVLQSQRLTASLAHEIHAVYTDLCQQVPPADVHATQAKARAQRNGWAPPAAWEAVDIDDPDAQPDWAAVRCESECGRAVKPGHLRCPACLKRLKALGTLDGYSPLRNGRALAEDAWFISKNEGLSLGNEQQAAMVAERLGVTLAALQASLVRHGTMKMQAERLAKEETQ
ncbi:hypothetical protein GBF35_25755 [Nonomuraea phyllanthi]|uniref:hypothetical protein n=1 Tax=Nonomuraea phyllanthi TaxID=2219224 RepID=UPI0012931649|nr:hypothetical protein [Nonomuraea phyllanthi]QFY09605.1 hypothetical protein GBF35_25755 [Nonomuraea phyllanthi]